MDSPHGGRLRPSRDQSAVWGTGGDYWRTTPRDHQPKPLRLTRHRLSESEAVRSANADERAASRLTEVDAVEAVHAPCGTAKQRSLLARTGAAHHRLHAFQTLGSCKTLCRPGSCSRTCSATLQTPRCMSQRKGDTPWPPRRTTVVPGVRTSRGPCTASRARLPSPRRSRVPRAAGVTPTNGQILHRGGLGRRQFSGARRSDSGRSAGSEQHSEVGDLVQLRMIDHRVKDSPSRASTAMPSRKVRSISNAGGEG